MIGGNLPLFHLKITHNRRNFRLKLSCLFILISNLSYPFGLTFQRSWFIYISNAVQKAFQIPSAKHFIYISWNGSEWYQFGLYLKCVFKRFFHAQSKYISKVHFIGIPWNGYGWYHLEWSWNVYLKSFHAQSKYISNWNVFEMLKSLFHSTFTFQMHSSIPQCKDLDIMAEVENIRKIREFFKI